MRRRRKSFLQAVAENVFPGIFYEEAWEEEISREERIEEEMILAEARQREAKEKLEARAEAELEAKQTEAGEEQGECETQPENREVLAQVNMQQLENFDYLLNHFFVVDPSTAAGADLINLQALMGKDMSLQGKGEGPQILIYHTHSQEAFADSVEGDVSTTIVGAGERLAELLRERGFEVLHHTAVYDVVNGQLDRNAAYSLAGVDIQRILAENPSIEVVIDLHRDGVNGPFVKEINGKPTAQIMFFNGLSRTAANEPVDYLPNPYIADNLAFSFQLQLKAAQYYPGFTRNIYLQSLRYNLHLCPKSLLIEAGTYTNTVEEEMNAMEPLADILSMVLLQ